MKWIKKLEKIDKIWEISSLWKIKKSGRVEGWIYIKKIKKIFKINKIIIEKNI